VAYSPEHIKRLVDGAADYTLDPHLYMLWNWPWGEPGTELEKWPGPDDWQLTAAKALSVALRSPKRGEPIRLAIGGANGSGKSCFASMIIDWAMCTLPYTRGTVTANTATQLRTKTWAELSKWRQMAVTKPILQLQATTLYRQPTPENPREWRIDAVPWNKDRPEGTAGMHNQNRRVLLLTDEASGVPDIIWEYQDASTTDDETEIIWIVLGNTTRNSGRFKECWGKFDSRWIKPTGPGITNGKVDGRYCRATNKKLIAQWIEDYGEDSDYVRVRVRAEFPRVGDMQYFPSDWIYDARKRSMSIEEVGHTPAVLAVDVAGSGKNKTVVTCRRGQRVMWQRSELYTPDTMALVGRLLDIITTERNVSHVCVDANGIGKGVADRLSELHTLQPTRVPQIVHVMGAHASSDPIQYRNLRSELFARCRDWLRQADIPYDSPLIAQMEAFEGGYNAVMQMEVETKDRFMERTDSDSPDEMDSLVYSFAERSPAASIRGKMRKRELAQGRPL
jgi:hypothetical protein